MAVFKCKMCGGALEITPDSSVAVCTFCGTKQTLPRLDDEQRANLYDRANHFRRNNDYDKAMSLYEQILATDKTDAEAYWSILLCKYGVEYVEDPATHKMVPTINRAQYTSIFADEDYKAAIQYADGYQRDVYEQDAKALDAIQKEVIAISQQEEPYDVFICYKETDNNGRRTIESVLANDLYHQLVQEGFKVFYARITLEDKIGSAYEPYIFAALNSAKVMVVLGTKPEHFNAVWVKNEWSRYLSLVKKSGGKKVLIPAYRDMDPYDLPEEFSHLQAQDMSKLGFMLDLIRGIKKIANVDESMSSARGAMVVDASNANVEPLLERAFLFLEDGKWQDANIYCEKVLDINPKNAEAYLCKLMASLRIRNRELLADQANPIDDDENYTKVLRYGDEKLKSEISGYGEQIHKRLLFVKAIDNNDTELAISLIDAGADVNYVSTYEGDKCPVLISAIAKGNEQMVELLLRKGANPNCEQVDNTGARFSALLDAIAVWPNDKIARMLIDAGADVNYVGTNDHLKCPILISAIMKGNEQMVELMLRKGANPNCKCAFSNGSYSALSDAIAEWPNDKIARMLIDAGADVNYVDTCDNLKYPVLIHAIVKGNEQMVELLLRKGANPNCERAFNNGNRYSALTDAIAEWPNDKIARLLIDAGADVNYVATKGELKYPVLISAIVKGNEQMVELMLRKGANPNCEKVVNTGVRFSALRTAKMQWPFSTMVKMLKKYGARKGSFFDN